MHAAYSVLVGDVIITHGFVSEISDIPVNARLRTCQIHSFKEIQWRQKKNNKRKSELLNWILR